MRSQVGTAQSSPENALAAILSFGVSRRRTPARSSTRSETTRPATDPLTIDEKLVRHVCRRQDRAIRKLELEARAESVADRTTSRGSANRTPRLSSSERSPLRRCLEIDQAQRAAPTWHRAFRPRWTRAPPLSDRRPARPPRAMRGEQLVPRARASERRARALGPPHPRHAPSPRRGARVEASPQRWRRRRWARSPPQTQRARTSVAP